MVRAPMFMYSSNIETRKKPKPRSERLCTCIVGGFNVMNDGNVCSVEG